MADETGVDRSNETKADEWGNDRAEFLPPWPRNKAGDFLKPFVGQIVSVETVENLEGLSGEPRDVDLYTVVDSNGERFTIWGSGMLARVLPAHADHHLVKIEDKGLEMREDKTQLRRFSVRCKTCTEAGK